MRKILFSFFFLLASQGFSFQKIFVLNINDYIINPICYEYIKEGIEKAKSESAKLLIIKLNTPGGLLESTRKIVTEILNSKVPVCVYVYPKGARAASAGVFILLSADIAAMSPQTHTGAAHPVLANKSWGNLDEELKKKIINDTISWIESIAKKRNRNVNWAKRAVLESESIDEIKAKKLKVIDFIAKDLNELLNKITKQKNIKLNLNNVKIIEIKMTLRQKILNHIINPQVAYLLMLLGFFALLYEVTHPGFGFPGVFGVISLLLAFYAFQVLPINFVGIVLTILGILFLIIEIFTPTFGIFTLGGITCLALGALMLFNQPAPFLKLSLKIVFPVIISMGLITLFLLTKIFQAHTKKPLTGLESLVGKTGVAYTKIDKKGKVFIKGEIWEAFSDTVIEKDEEVIVEKVEGMRLKVKRRGENG